MHHYHRFERGDIVVRGAIVVVDVLTNDVRGTRGRRSATPQELLHRVARLREGILRAAAVVICQIKPMQVANVIPFNTLIDDYLRAQGGTGYRCRTQIRIDNLKKDGFHVRPEFDSVIDRTFACALMGVLVPRPTQIDDFLPDHARRRREVEWPRLVGAGMPTQNGGRW